MFFPAAVWVAVITYTRGSDDNLFIPGIIISAATVIHLIITLVTPSGGEMEEDPTCVSFFDLIITSGLVFMTGGQDSPIVGFYFVLLALYSVNKKTAGNMVSASVTLVAYLITLIIYSNVHSKGSEVILNLKNLFYVVMFFIASSVGSFTYSRSDIENFNREVEKKKKKKKSQSLSQDKLLEEAQKKLRQIALEKEEKEKNLYDMTRKLQSLIEISRRMSSIRKADDLMEMIVSKAREEINSGIGFIMLREGNVLKIKKSMGLSTLTVEELNEKQGGKLFNEVLTKKKALRLNRRDDDPRFKELLPLRENFQNLMAIPLKASEVPIAIGVLCVANLRVGNEYTHKQENYLRILATDATIALRNIILFEELRRAYMEIIQVLAQAIEAKDPYTHGHVARVREIAVRIARTMKLPDEKVELISKAAILHDVGKISTPESILLKPDKLTDTEFKIMKDHARASLDILKGIKSLEEDVMDMVVHHHERYDGKGYPDGLSGEDIPLGAHIIAVADVYDALTTDRPYRKAWTEEKAVSVMAENAGTQFHPKVMDAFLKTLGFSKKKMKKMLALNSSPKTKKADSEEEKKSFEAGKTQTEHEKEKEQKVTTPPSQTQPAGE